MPGYTIHIAIANEYRRKHKKEIKDKEAKKHAKELNEKPEILTYKRVKKFIHKISQISIEQQIDEINKNGNPII